MITTNIPTLQIHKLTEEQYEAAKLAGTLEENALYMTPDEGVDLTGYATEDYVDAQIDAIPEVDLTWDKIQGKPTVLEDFANIKAIKIVTNLIGLTPDNITATGAIRATDDGVMFSGLMEPTEGNMAATKNYVDTAISSIPTPTFSATDDGNGNITITLG